MNLEVSFGVDFAKAILLVMYADSSDQSCN